MEVNKAYKSIQIGFSGDSLSRASDAIVAPRHLAHVLCRITAASRSSPLTAAQNRHPDSPPHRCTMHDGRPVSTARYAEELKPSKAGGGYPHPLSPSAICSRCVTGLTPGEKTKRDLGRWRCRRGPRPFYAFFFTNQPVSLIE